MKIYIASSWKNAEDVHLLAEILSLKGHKVDAFCEERKDRYVFSWRSLGKKLKEWDAITFLKTKEAQKAFQEDKKWLDWTDCCVLLLPAGNSSHLEAGYAKGRGKLLYIYHLDKFPKGEFDVMYGFADGLFREATELMEALNAKPAAPVMGNGVALKATPAATKRR